MLALPRMAISVQASQNSTSPWASMADKTRATTEAQSAESTYPPLAERSADAASRRACVGMGIRRWFTSTSTQASEGAKLVVSPAPRRRDEARSGNRDKDAIASMDMAITDPCRLEDQPQA